MASTILGNLWQSSLYGETNTLSVHSKFMQQLGNYITSNVTFNITFTGSLIYYPFTPIVTSDVVKINGAPTSATIVSFSDPAGGNGLPQWMSWIQQVYAGIAKSLIIGPLTIPTGVITAFPTMINPTWTRDDLLYVHQANWDDPQGHIMDKLATNIMADMRKFYIPSYPAIYATSYIGVATVNLVNTP